MKHFTALAFAAALFSGLSALTPLTTSAHAACVVNVAQNDVLNVRSGPSTRNPIVGILSPGQCGVTIVQRTGGDWGYVSWSNGQGWVNLRFIGERAPAPATACVVGVAFNDVLNIRAAGTSASRIVGVIPPNGCGVRVFADNGSWARIRYNGITGWVSRRFLAY